MVSFLGFRERNYKAIYIILRPHPAQPIGIDSLIGSESPSRCSSPSYPMLISTRLAACLRCAFNHAFPLFRIGWHFLVSRRCNLQEFVAVEVTGGPEVLFQAGKTDSFLFINYSNSAQILWKVIGTKWNQWVRLHLWGATELLLSKNSMQQNKL